MLVGAQRTFVFNTLLGQLTQISQQRRIEETHKSQLGSALYKRLKRSETDAAKRITKKCKAKGKQLESNSRSRRSSSNSSSRSSRDASVDVNVSCFAARFARVRYVAVDLIFL